MISVAIGFAIAFALALIAHRQRWLTGPIVGVTGRALHGAQRGWRSCCSCRSPAAATLTAIIALVAYTLLILFRNITTGLRNVPLEAGDAARGMGMTDNQILRRVELPLAMPRSWPACGSRSRRRSAWRRSLSSPAAAGSGARSTASAPAPAASSSSSRTSWSGGLAVLLAALGDVIILTIQRFALRPGAVAVAEESRTPGRDRVARHGAAHHPDRPNRAGSRCAASHPRVRRLPRGDNLGRDRDRPDRLAFWVVALC